ncbi:TWiK family of potassium channels protein 18-like [Limulus polyphemus]|uniref:TWiK family of potassium channels protein 18-like n=1 Tax=Limulus polyphemus TaxID=6850 RepID=A0ABM1BJT4_LIMPO|nr:TWiK family of potassium channels protein 18-like [Limulus polyphemus]
MHIVTLTKTKESCIVRYAEKIKSVSEKWFTHVLLLLFLLGYAALGAVIFQWIEGSVEYQEKVSIENMRILIINDLWALYKKHNKEEDWREHAMWRLAEYEQQVFQSFNSSTKKDSLNRQWTFLGAMFYCGTVFTTIGYGNISPSTNTGRAATIVYAFFGIPLMLMVLADLGKLFTRTIKFIYFYIRQFYHTGKCRKNRRVARKDKNHTVQYMTVKLNSDNETDPTSSVVDSEKTSSSFIRVMDGKYDLELDNKASGATPSDSFESDDEFNLPISLGLFFLVIYIMIGAFIFTLWEDWSFVEAFYFVFISMSTIGFGDYIPEHPIYMIATFIYLLFGLALTSMCINVVQEKLSATFEKAKIRIGTTMGLDAHSLLQDRLAPKVAKLEIAEVHGRRRWKEEISDETENIDKNTRNEIEYNIKETTW